MNTSGLRRPMASDNRPDPNPAMTSATKVTVDSLAIM